MKFNKSGTKSRWVDYKDMKFLIRPYANSAGALISLNPIKVAEYGWLRFNHCVENWKGLVDENDKPLKCNEENKKCVYDNSEEIIIFIGQEVEKLNEGIVTESKN